MKKSSYDCLNVNAIPMTSTTKKYSIMNIFYFSFDFPLIVRKVIFHDP